MLEARHLPIEELEAQLDEIRRFPRDGGKIELIVRRPATGEREVRPTAPPTPRCSSTS